MSVLNADAAAEPKGPQKDPLQTWAACPVGDSGVQDGSNRIAPIRRSVRPRSCQDSLAEGDIGEGADSADGSPFNLVIDNA